MGEVSRSDSRILCITNDFGPRAGGIETFVIGLIERLPRSHVIVYTSAQDNSEEYDRRWLEDFGVEVVRDKAKILLPTPGVAYCVKAIVRERNISTVFFGAAAPLGLLSQGLRKAGVQHIVALTHGHEVWWSKVWPFTLAMKSISRHVNHLTYLGEFTRRAIAQSLTKDAVQSMVKIAPGIDTDHFAPQPSAAALRAELNALKAQVKAGGGGAAKGAQPPADPPAVLGATKLCAHCTSDKHNTEDCWYLHVPLVGGKLVISPEVRAKVRVAHGLPAVFVRSATPKKARAPSPSVNSSLCLGGLRAGGAATASAAGRSHVRKPPLLREAARRRGASRPRAFRFPGDTEFRGFGVRFLLRHASGSFSESVCRRCARRAENDFP